MTIDQLIGVGAAEVRATQPAPRVLVAEDDAALRRLLAELLELGGYAALEASSVSQALRLAREHSPAVILLDLALRDGSGLEVLRELRASAATRHIPVVMISGCSESASARPAPHPEAFLRKPFDVDVVLEHVDRMVRIGAVAAGREPAGASSGGTG